MENWLKSIFMSFFKRKILLDCTLRVQCPRCSFGCNMRLYISGLCVPVHCTGMFFVLSLYWTVSEEACPHHECACVCVCVLSRKGEKIYCNLAISVFIYNDWAFAIQNVSLYIEYENIYDLCMYETCNWLGFVVLQQFLLLKWYEFVLKGLTLLSYALFLWGERSCLVGGLLQTCFLFFK